MQPHKEIAVTKKVELDEQEIFREQNIEPIIEYHENALNVSYYGKFRYTGDGVVHVGDA